MKPHLRLLPPLPDEDEPEVTASSEDLNWIQSAALEADRYLRDMDPNLLSPAARMLLDLEPLTPESFPKVPHKRPELYVVPDQQD